MQILNNFGVSNSNRGLLWIRLIGNSMQITPEHYERYLEHSKLQYEEHLNAPPDDTSTLDDLIANCKLIVVDVARTFPLKEFDGVLANPNSTFCQQLINVLQA
jgi:hypothetical protein